MPNPSYAALLRECADTLAQSDGSLARVRKAEQLNSLADLLERITPEVVDAVYEAAFWYPRHRALQDALDILRALATGPQPEEGRDAS